MALTQFSTIAGTGTTGDAPNVWIAQQMYKLAEKNLRIGSSATKYQLPQRMGKQLRIIRHKRLNLPTGVLTEGTAPTAVALSVEEVNVTVEQWGIVVQLTDVVQITTKHPALQVAITRTALAMAEVLEREMAVMLLGGTSVVYPGSVTARTGIGSSDKIDTAAVLKATTQLRTQGAGESEGGLFRGILSPAQEGDILGSDQTFKDASNFANVKALQFGEIGVWMGVRWTRGNFMPIFSGTPTIDGTAVTATRSKGVKSSSSNSDTFAGVNVIVVVVARDATTDFERFVSQSSTIVLDAQTDDVTLSTPTSTNYVYDIYADDGNAGTIALVAARVANSTDTVITQVGQTTQSPPVAPPNGREVFVAWIFGNDAFGRVELNGMSLQSYITPAGASFSNPLAQSRKVGSKIMWKSFIIDNNYFVRLESSSTYSAQLPA